MVDGGGTEQHRWLGDLKASQDAFDLPSLRRDLTGSVGAPSAESACQRNAE